MLTLIRQIVVVPAIAFVSLIMWYPLIPFGRFELMGTPLNWMAPLIGFGTCQMYCHFINFQQGKAKIRHCLIVALICPVWPVWTIVKKIASHGHAKVSVLHRTIELKRIAIGLEKK